jgi:acylphosphatase
MPENDEELEERRNAELEFISAAYDPAEAWWENNNDEPVIYRRLKLAARDENEASTVSVLLALHMVPGYPESQGLDITFTIEGNNNTPGSNSSSLMRVAYKAVPNLIETCREVIAVGEESVLLVLSQSDEWIEDTWPEFLERVAAAEPTTTASSSLSTTQILGRRLIYSHHLISKIKRADIRNLASHFKLTGYMKIGWPGIVILEGPEDNCSEFYDHMRRWNWKYLVMRGEQQERVLDLEASRKFDHFIETEDMSQVAQHCRDAGLEALFRTSMKVYDNTGEHQPNDDEDEEAPYGTLIYVDHMNDTKGYRKWLRKTAKEVDCFLLMKQSYPNHDFSRRPVIVVGIAGESDAVHQFMKRWRTSRVDVDSKGKPCLERTMTVLVEGQLDPSSMLASIDWDESHGENSINVSEEELLVLVESVGGKGWKEALVNASN